MFSKMEGLAEVVSNKKRDRAQSVLGTAQRARGPGSIPAPRKQT
jgi:hypothetical protein